MRADQMHKHKTHFSLARALKTDLTSTHAVHAVKSRVAFTRQRTVAEALLVMCGCMMMTHQFFETRLEMPFSLIDRLQIDARRHYKYPVLPHDIQFLDANKQKAKGTRHFAIHNSTVCIQLILGTAQHATMTRTRLRGGHNL